MEVLSTTEYQARVRDLGTLLSSLERDREVFAKSSEQCAIAFYTLLSQACNGALAQEQKATTAWLMNTGDTASKEAAKAFATDRANLIEVRGDYTHLLELTTQQWLRDIELMVAAQVDLREAVIHRLGKYRYGYWSRNCDSMVELLQAEQMAAIHTATIYESRNNLFKQVIKTTEAWTISVKENYQKLL